MPSTIAYSLRLLCIALACSFAVLLAAEPPSPLLGSNREQVIRKLGEPRSQLAVGNRLVMLYARERVVLRDGVVVEVERIFAEPTRRPAPTPVVAAPPVAAAPAAPGAPAAVEAVPGVAPAAPAAAAGVSGAAPAVATAVPAGVATAPVAVGTAPVVQATDAPVAAPVQPAPPPPPEPKLEIKLIRPPSAGGASAAPTRLSSKASASSAVSTPSAPPPTPAANFATKEAVAPAPVPASSPAPVPPAATPKAAATAVPASPKAEPAPVATPPVVSETPAEAPSAAAAEAAEAEEKAKRDAEKAAVAAAEKKAKLIKASRRRLEAVVDDATPVPATSGISTRTYVIALVTIFGCSGYLYWRVRQRRLELAATRVSQTPFSDSTPRSEPGGAVFTAEFLTKLEWKRFEELVESYYSKTGVVATRSKGGPSGAAQVKIAWKGEPRPFALVRCISHPRDLIEVKPLQELYTLLASEDIRRGYVVTSGKFSVAARDYAEEKHLTLLPGDIFLEKLNALPGPARTEIMQAASAGDATTPSCPTCEAKMTRSTDVPPVWRCANHPDVTLPT